MSLTTIAAGSVSFTDHARARMQQRGICADALEALLDHGRVCHLHSQGCELVYFGKKARKGFPNIYAVLGANGTVITVGHRYRRVKEA
jgi:hypothetical protein